MPTPFENTIIRTDPWKGESYTPGSAQLDSEGISAYVLAEAHGAFTSPSTQEPPHMALRSKNLLQFHPHAYLGERSKALGRTLSLYDIPNSLLDWIKARGFEGIWLTGIWDRGQSARKNILNDLAQLNALKHHVPELETSEIIGSPFSIRSYLVPPSLGGEDALRDLRRRMNARGIALVLDFVANHMSRDCSWVDSHTEAFVMGRNTRSLEQDSFRLPHPDGKAVSIAYGRDPYFPGWPFTAQLDARSDVARQLLRGAIQRVSAQCDGLQCSMAMLGLNETFDNTWGKSDDWFSPKTHVTGELWDDLITAARTANPQLFLTAEAYWGQEWTLQSLGFDFTWDKILYDRLRDGDAESIRNHLRGDMDFQGKSVRFLETHFQDRAAASFTPERHRASLALMLSSPGLSMLSYGQLLGAKNRQPLTVTREPHDAFNREIPVLYEAMCRGFQHPAKLDGSWFLIDLNDIHQSEDVSAIVASAWHHPEQGVLLTVVNFGDLPLNPNIGFSLPSGPFNYLNLVDRLGRPTFEGTAHVFQKDGFAIPMAPWGVKIIEIHQS